MSWIDGCSFAARAIMEGIKSVVKKPVTCKRNVRLLISIVYIFHTENMLCILSKIFSGPFRPTE